MRCRFSRISDEYLHWNEVLQTRALVRQVASAPYPEVALRQRLHQILRYQDDWVYKRLGFACIAFTPVAGRIDKTAGWRQSVN